MRLIRRKKSTRRQSVLKKCRRPQREKPKKLRSVKKESARKRREGKRQGGSLNQETLFLQKAFHYHRQGKFNQAIQMYQQVLKVKPYHRDALFNLASAYIHLTAYSEAYPLLKKLRSLRPWESGCFN